ENVVIDRATNPHQMLDELNHAADAEPPSHRARNLVADQISQHCGIADITLHRRPHHTANLVANFFLTQKLDVLFPRERDQDAHVGGDAFLKKPCRRCVINPKHVDTDLAHHSKIDIHLFRPSELIAIRIRFERAVGHALDEKLLIAFEKEFRSYPDPCSGRVRHSERSTSPTISAVRAMSLVVCAVEMNPVSN